MTSDSTDLFDLLGRAIDGETPAVLATVVALEPVDETDPTDLPELGSKILIGVGDKPLGSFGNDDLDRVVIRDATGELSAGTTGLRHYGPRGEARAEDVAVFVETFAPPPQMLIFGAVDFTAALTRVAKVLGYRVTVCDARPVFATNQRFPYADEVVVDWPNRLLTKVGPQLSGRDAICILTHDPKFDIPAALEALQTDVGYIGAMGSRRTTEDRNERLRAEGVTEADISRIRGPIGLDLGGRTPEETAISICAEIISMRSGRKAAALKDVSGAIH